MSHLWVVDRDGEWVDRPLDAAVVAADSGAPVGTHGATPSPGGAGPVLHRTRGEHGSEGWMLLCPPSGRVRVNGAPLPAGARLLADRDAIALGGGRTVYFSSESLARVTSFAGADSVTGAATCCIRCKLPLEAGTPAVRCPAPGCGFWHHQSERQPCWTYAGGCAGCGHPTAFDAGFQWSPWAP